MCPKNTQAILRKIRLTIKKNAPKAEEAIKYGIPTFRLLNTNLVHFAGYEKHIGFYPTASGVHQFAQKLKSYKTSKGAIQLPIDAVTLPLTLIADITKFRVKEVMSKKLK